MCYYVFQRLVPFLLAFSFSALLVISLRSDDPVQKSREQLALQAGMGSGSAIGSGTGRALPPSFRGPNSPVFVTFQPKALYTDEARANNVQGAVRLKITLLANGTVGNVTPVTELPDGLTQQAIDAARKIKFEPKMVNGVPAPVVVTREYVFTIY